MSTDALNRSRSGEAIITRHGFVAAVAFELLPAFAYREHYTIYNNATVPLYVSFGAEPDGQTFSLIIQPQGFYEAGPTSFTSAIHGIFTEEGTGDVLVTDFRS